jgi:hypothetical protein
VQGVQGPQQTAVSSTHINTIDAENAAAINKRIGDLGAQIEILTKVIGEQSELKENGSIEVRDSVEQTIAALNDVSKS